jgi:FMN phosphatase YigB (HAD superfamily)
MRASEIQPRKLVIFDIDDTLVHTQTKVHVVKDGRVVKSLNSHDFTHYKLQPGEQFDFGDFRDAREFFHNSKPIIPMMNQLKHDIATGNNVVMVTARADFDDKELFLDTFRKYGVDMNKVHVYRAGNMTGKMQTEEKKKIIIRNLLDKGQYTKAIMYDDALPNLHSFVELKKEYPHTKFYAWQVSLDGEASEYDRTNETVDEAEGTPSGVPHATHKLIKHIISQVGHEGAHAIIKSLNWGDGASKELLHLIVNDLKQNIKENFADGKHPERKGLAKRSGINTKASVTSLRNTAKHSSGEKQRMAHWLANMKAGRAKKK